MAVRDLTLARREGVDITKLTDSTAGTADGTLAAVSAGVTGVDGTGSNAASKVDLDATLVDINNNFAEINAKLDALADVLRKRP